MSDDLKRRAWLKQVGAVSAGAMLGGSLDGLAGDRLTESVPSAP
jgi:hypothetical protein